ncbi:MAG: hypothetical protein GC165_07565 [Armatimonadetes bacterium]|nr:hypothetical protein [Armatimonadota bacterium]
MGGTDSASVAAQRHRELLRQVKALKDEIQSWLESAMVSDVRQQYQTQLAALGRSLEVAVDQIQERIVADKPAGQVFKAAVAEERYLLWIRAIWDPFRVAFEQRTSGDASTTLKLADELVWACFYPFAERAGTRRSAPLATIANVAPCIRPSDMTRNFVNASLPAELQDRVNQVLKSLPMAILYLPPTVVASPWQLCLVAHEVGHEIQHIWADENGQSMVQTFQAELTDLAGADWNNRGQEVFADLYSVHCIGPAAAYTLFDFVFGEADDMQKGDAKYPPAIVRIQLANRLSTKLGLGTAKLPLMDEPEYCPAALGEQLDGADKIVDYVVGQQNPCLKHFGLDRAEFSSHALAKPLWDDKQPLSKPSVATIRQLFHQARVAVEDVTKDDDAETLRRNLERRVMDNVPSGVRAVVKVDMDAFSPIEKAFDEIPNDLWSRDA